VGGGGEGGGGEIYNRWVRLTEFIAENIAENMARPLI